MFNKTIKNEKGVAIILVAVAIVVLFGFGALAIDVGHLYNVKNQLQAAADAAALAGAAELDDTNTIDQTKARDEAQRIAALNFADVANVTVPPLGKSPGAAPGKPIPVALRSSQDDGDIVVGFWDGSNFYPGAATAPDSINAVKVVARRTGAPDSAQPRANNWFAKVFSLLPLGTRFDFSAISAEAIAAKGLPLEVKPIAVNEYWYAADGYKNQRPYDATVHAYPNSFVRMKQVNFKDQPQNVTSLAFGYTFAILGARAESNQGSGEPNGYVDLDLRADYYLGGPLSGGDITPNIYTAIDSTGDCSTSCNNYFNGPSTTDPSYETERLGTGVKYLVDGYPKTRLPPTAIYELKRTDYSANDLASVTEAYNSYNQPSDCPHAVIHYFQLSGTPPLNYSDNKPGSTKVVANYYKAGDRFIALVYDGTHSGGNGGEPHGKVDKLAVTVGYVPIEIDGYSGKMPDKIGLLPGTDAATYAHNKSVLWPSWDLATGNPNTLYGHALSDIIQADPATPKGGCDILSLIKEAQEKYKTVGVHLVGPREPIGMATHP